jgi:hypothetical protein
MALLALSPFDIFTSLFFSFCFFSIGKKGNILSSYWSCLLNICRSTFIWFGIIQSQFTFWFGSLISHLFFFLISRFHFERFIVNIHFVSTSLVGVSHNMYITFFLIRFGEIGRAKSMYNESLSVASYSNIIGDKSAIARKKKFWFVAEFSLKGNLLQKKI